MCAHGYTVADSPTNFYFASDLLHRIFHIPRISLGAVEHYSEDYDDVLTLAKTNSSLSVVDSDALQYFALEVFSYVVFPKKGCPGGNTTEPTTSVTRSALPSKTPTPVTLSTKVVPSTTKSADEVSRSSCCFG